MGAYYGSLLYPSFCIFLATPCPWCDSCNYQKFQSGRRFSCYHCQKCGCIFNMRTKRSNQEKWRPPLIVWPGNASLKLSATQPKRQRVSSSYTERSKVSPTPRRTTTITTAKPTAIPPTAHRRTAPTARTRTGDAKSTSPPLN